MESKPKQPQKFSFYKQPSTMDCGPTCLRMVAKYHGKHFTVERIKSISGFNKEGVSMLGIADAARGLGLSAKGVQLTFSELVDGSGLPAILHWNQNHFVVLPKQDFSGEKILIADPGQESPLYIPIKTFQESWIQRKNKDRSTGIALLLQPTEEFYQQAEEQDVQLSWKKLYEYVKGVKSAVLKVFALLLAASLLQFLFPFLTQSIVDRGINGKDLDFLALVFLGQLVLVATRAAVDYFKARLLFKVSTHINLSILSNFWVKMIRLPLSYFENHHTAETFQRVADHRQIENFLTGSATTTSFALLNFLVFSVVFVLYSPFLFLVFVVGSALYLLWVSMFLRRRRKLNYELFHISTKENNATLQLVQGMQELKLYQAEDAKRNEWEGLQREFYQTSLKNLTLNQTQEVGASLLNEGRNLVLTFLAAKLVVDGSLTLGVMLAVQYIIGQLNGPLEQFVNLVQSAQDAKISMERLNEVHGLPDERSAAGSTSEQMPIDRSLYLENVSFAYPGSGDDPVLRNVTVEIPQGKVTAIVGVSGSGKTTLLKILLRFFDRYDGTIKVGDTDFSNINPVVWREHCGAVLQGGYIFNDTIARNIALGGTDEDMDQVIAASKVANIHSFITSLPNGYHSKLGVGGSGLSQGQKQRLLIARSVYKNPDFLFLDEATNSLDATNERVILSNMHQIFPGKTVVVVAHRLSTVKNAENIIVLDRGEVAEQGTHVQLCALKGRYYTLISDQLELGN